MISTILGIVLGVVKAIPILDSWVKAFFLEYAKRAAASHEKELLAGLITAMRDGDQRALEEALGSDTAGQPTQDQTDVVRRPRRRRTSPPSVVVLAALLLSSCTYTREQVQADVWLAEAIPSSLCTRYPAVRDYGHYRVVACTRDAEREGICERKPDCSQLSAEECNERKTYEEFISYCSATKFLGMREKDAREWLKKVPKK